MTFCDWAPARDVRIAMRRLALVLLLLASCKKSREDTCDQLAKMGTAFANELGKRVSGDGDLGESTEIKSKMAELKAACMKWPDDVFECMRDNDETSPKCREAMQHVTGRIATDLSKAPAGPKVVATADIGKTSWDRIPFSLQSDGSIVAAVQDGLVSYAATGKPNWRVLMDHDEWMLVQGDVVLTGDRKRKGIVAFDLETGTEKWIAMVPQGEDDHRVGSVFTEAGVRVDGSTYVLLDTGAVVKVNPTSCTSMGPDCLDLVFAFENEEFDHPTLFPLGKDIVLVESNAIRRVSTSGEILGYIHVRDDMGGATPAGGEKVAATFDDELVVIDFARCTGTRPIALPRKAGRMYLRGEGECEGGCRTPPEGCIYRSPLDEVDSVAPTVLRDGSIVASNWDGPLHTTSKGEKLWVTEVHSSGPLREAGANVVFLSYDGEDKPPRVAALDRATGKAAWVTPLVGWQTKDFPMSSEVTVETNEQWIVVGVKGRFAWLEL